MFLLRRLNLTLTSLLLVVGVCAGWHASREGFTQSWRESIRKEFETQGIHLSLGRLTLDPFNGFVAHDVRLYEDETRDRARADISRIDLDVSIPSLFQKRFDIKGVQIRDASATLPLDDGQGNIIAVPVENCHARIYLNRDEIEIRELRGLVFGVHFGFTGELIRPVAGDSGAAGGEEPGLLWGEYGTWLHQFAALMESVEVDAREPAELRIRALADLGRVEDGRFELSLRAPALVIAGHPLEELSLHVLYDAGTLTADSLRFRDAGGIFRAEVDFVRESRALTFSLESHTRLLDNLRRNWWPEDWPVLELDDAPMLTMGGRVHLERGAPLWPPQGLLTGSVLTGGGNAAGVPLRFASAAFSVDAERLFLRDFRVRTGTGEIRGDLIRRPGGLDARGLATVHPEELLPFSTHHVATGILDSFRCNDRSHTEFAFEINFPAGDDGGFGRPTLDSRFLARDISFKGMPFAEAAARWTFDGSEHHFHQPELTIARNAPLPRGPARTAAATTASAERVSLRGPKLRMEFDSLVAEGWPITVLSAFAPKAAAALPAFRHNDPCVLHADGTLVRDLRDDTHLRISVQSEGTFFWPVVGTELPLENPEASLLLEDATLVVSRLRADLFGGRADSRLRLDNLGGVTDLSGSVALNDVSYQELMALFSANEDPAKGSFDLALRFDMPEIELRRLSGGGQMRLSDGDLFSIPVFGPLSPLVEAALPNSGLGYSVASEASADFVIGDGILDTRNFNATTPSFLMETRGTVNLVTRDIDLSSRLNARGAARIATSVLSYIFEYKGEGTLDEPGWHAHRLPRLPVPRVPNLLDLRENGADR